MKNSLLLVGIGAIVIVLGTWIAINQDFTPAPENEINSSQEAPMPAPLTLTSSDFQHNDKIPAKFTCDGAQLNPRLLISGVPAGARSLALIMDDPDIPKLFKDQRGIEAFDHWILFNIPANTTEIPSGTSAGVAGANGSGESTYTGPCPPREYEPSEHGYSFRLYALDAELSLQAGATKKEVEAAMQGHIVAETELIGRYKRP